MLTFVVVVFLLGRAYPCEMTSGQCVSHRRVVTLVLYRGNDRVLETVNNDIMAKTGVPG